MEFAPLDYVPVNYPPKEIPTEDSFEEKNFTPYQDLLVPQNTPPSALPGCSWCYAGWHPDGSFPQNESQD
ncbi:hypothetical protein DSO57_1029413 [Entomophthora muscae]|uniref:Uncharacterized protein n=1 Tax=Entomophthora muscae TaxID=34485 RepID=A0ACC2TZ48_9FUNG|nr:hypothetical protein DSO57_1029413 [Entomophthora muscae]